MRTREVQSFYTLGSKQEEWVRQWFVANGFPCKHSTPTQDKQLDIDLWVTDKQGNVAGMSLKTSEVQYFTAPFVFELETVMNDGTVYDGWFYTSKADYWLVWKRDGDKTGLLYLMKESNIRKYVKRYGFDKVTGQKREVKEREAKVGKREVILGLISIENLVAEGIVKVLGRIEVDKLAPVRLSTKRVK